LFFIFSFCFILLSPFFLLCHFPSMDASSFAASHVKALAFPLFPFMNTSNATTTQWCIASCNVVRLRIKVIDPVPFRVQSTNCEHWSVCLINNGRVNHSMCAPYMEALPFFTKKRNGLCNNVKTLSSLKDVTFWDSSIKFDCSQFKHLAFALNLVYMV
jgi:hypothetical protein